MPPLKPGQLLILITNALLVVGFSLFFVSRGNAEFMMYIGVIIFFFGLILYTNDVVDYPNPVLWGLTVWSAMHLCGGGLSVNGSVLYNLMIVDVTGSEMYKILKYDQVVHTLGFAIATLVMYYVLNPLLKPERGRWIAVSIVVVMAGLGLGALNEIVEFTATVAVPDTNVGGYVNTSLDLVADLVGALIGLAYLLKVERNAPATP